MKIKKREEIIIEMFTIFIIFYCIAAFLLNKKIIELKQEIQTLQVNEVALEGLLSVLNDKIEEDRRVK